MTRIREIDIEEINGIDEEGRCESAEIVMDFIESGFNACEVECNGGESRKVAARLSNYLRYHELLDEVFVCRRGERVFLIRK